MTPAKKKAHPGVNGVGLNIHRDTTDTNFMHSIICASPAEFSDLSISGVEDTDPFAGERPDEPFEPTFEDVALYVDADGRDDENVRPDAGGVMRLSEAEHFRFWTYFVRYWPRKTFNVKYGYDRGFVEKKKRGTWQPQPLFEGYAVELAERHLDAGVWAAWKDGERQDDPIWLALHMPKSTTVDLIDVDAKQYRIGYYREGGFAKGRLMPVVHLPLDHFKLLKRVYDAFPGRIWCISSETLGVHAWRKHKYPRPSLALHEQNKKLLADIGLPTTEAHPMPGRCLRRPFGDGYRTVTAKGVLTEWTAQVDYFENDGRTPCFNRIAVELVGAMCRQWEAWHRWGDGNRKVKVRSVLETHRHELHEVVSWLKAGCPLAPLPAAPTRLDATTALCREVLAESLGERPPAEPTPLQRILRAIFLVSSGEKTDAEIAPLLEQASEQPTAGSPTSRRPAADTTGLASLRGGNWAKELLRLARIGLVEDDSVGTVVFEMAKWLWWIELYAVPEGQRREEITRLLTAFVRGKHNGLVSRLLNGQDKDVADQIARCVNGAAGITDPKSLNGFAATRSKWENGGYKHPIRIMPALTGKEEVPLSPPGQFTVMCINFDDPLPETVQGRIKKEAGRCKVTHFATGLLNWLYTKEGKAHLSRTALTKMLGYKNSNQIGKYLDILVRAGVITRGDSYKVGRNGKCYYLKDDVMSEMRQSRSLIAPDALGGGPP
jgi:hypothetical protein